MPNKTIVQALHHLIHNAGDGVMTKLFLLKTIYLADRYHLRQYGRSITGADYVAMRMGPVASQVKTAIESDIDGNVEMRKCFIPLGKSQDTAFKSVCVPARDFLSDTELEALDVALAQFKKVGSGNIVQYTHAFPEWKNCEESLTDCCQVVQMNIEDFFQPADANVEYCPADPELVEMNLDYYRGED